MSDVVVLTLDLYQQVLRRTWSLEFVSFYLFRMVLAFFTFATLKQMVRNFVL